MEYPTESRDLSADTLRRMVRTVEPSWDIQEAEPVERGFCTVYRLVVGDGETSRECYLKASSDGQPWGIPREARVCAVLDERTSLPVPSVLGVVDGHRRLPTPYYIATAMPGETLDNEQVGWLADDVLQRIARETGEHLGELHSVQAVDNFGHVRADEALRTGGVPGDDPAVLTVGEPKESWPAYLREYADRVLERHADSPFADLTPALRERVDAEIAGLEGPFRPVLGRNDHGLHNLLVDPETGEITAMLDWGYTLAVPASFDVASATYLYSGAYLAEVPDVTDRREMVREAILAGYRSRSPDRVERAAAREPVHRLLAMVRVMNYFDYLDLPEGTETAVKDRIRSDVQRLIDR